MKARHCERGEIRLWDIASGKPLEPVFSGHRGAVTSLSFRADGKVLASGSCAEVGQMLDTFICAKGQIILWDLATVDGLNQRRHARLQFPDLICYAQTHCLPVRRSSQALDRFELCR